ncbi:molybdate ABC transporter substrate-binding protein [endosymbiont 'TC1' of Trimyema compressum]|uniref:molybdate ABC transporter substrate-binding protein n=1 Tax=endosymbiont 'TC1' of Trimyema compressum TaxID=243899 RepID=UPI000AA08183|nr:molybdate ABC transporter substrate-binding protein [endosymbiont 'TC1' of Trimyema compressum]
MKNMLFKKSRSIVIGLLLLFSSCFLLVACGNNGTDTSKEPSKITVSAAASLKDVMEEIKTDYISKKKNVEIEYNFSSSGSLQQQIEQGAPADLFMSAAPKQMNALEEKDLIVKGTRIDLLKNRVVLIVPSDNNQVASFEDLTKDSVTKIGMGDPASVPVGVYTKDVLNYFKLFEKIESKLVYGKDVREVLSWVETKNAEAGVVYETDAKVASGVKVAATAPEDSHKPVTYPAAVLKDAQNQQGAKDFLNYLKGDEAKAKFEKFGFTKIQ